MNQGKVLVTSRSFASKNQEPIELLKAHGFEVVRIVAGEKSVEEQGATYVPLDELLKNADFISLHTPLSEQTRNMIGERELALMKPNAVLVNTARGGIVDEDALYQALKNGTIFAAGLDAMVCEPPVESPLLTLDNFVATSHFGGTTYDAVHKMSMMAVENLIDVIEKGSCPFALR